MFGDFEAQRHWMEVTYHLPITQWYTTTFITLSASKMTIIKWFQPESSGTAFDYCCCNTGEIVLYVKETQFLLSFRTAVLVTNINNNSRAYNVVQIMSQSSELLRVNITNAGGDSKCLTNGKF